MRRGSEVVGIVSLGCAKNIVDSEAILGELISSGFSITADEKEATTLIVNTCGFLQSARSESISTIHRLFERKKRGDLRYLIVTGCLPQRYKESLVEELPEVDGIFGVGNFLEIPRYLKKLIRAKAHTRPPIYQVQENRDSPLLGRFERVLSTPQSFAYVKISEGCSRACSFCTIPSIRGRMRSRSLEGIRSEVELLSRQGVAEIILIGQDLTSYGRDLTPRLTLTELMESLLRIPELGWLRILYNYPQNISDRFIDLLATHPKMTKYIDIPFQHASDPVLRRMNRPETAAEIRSLIARFRTEIPKVAIRTTLMVGFPGETDADFAELESFVRESEFENLGIFSYSAEEGSRSAEMDGHVEESVKESRRNRLMELQFEIVRRRNANRVGSTETVLIDGKAADALYSARSEAQAPEVDGVTLIQSAQPLIPGSFIDVKITEAHGYDLLAEVDLSSRSFHDQSFSERWDSSAGRASHS